MLILNKLLDEIKFDQCSFVLDFSTRMKKLINASKTKMLLVSEREITSLDWKVIRWNPWEVRFQHYSASVTILSMSICIIFLGENQQWVSSYRTVSVFFSSLDPHVKQTSNKKDVDNEKQQPEEPDSSNDIRRWRNINDRILSIRLYRSRLFEILGCWGNTLNSNVVWRNGRETDPIDLWPFFS